ncbi:MAG: hypothetical protein II894_04225 [Bacteroidales bacterium]|nr:hypothetical protein [Bacteroidales bacterium]
MQRGKGMDVLRSERIFDFIFNSLIKKGINSISVFFENDQVRDAILIQIHFGELGAIETACPRKRKRLFILMINSHIL